MTGGMSILSAHEPAAGGGSGTVTSVALSVPAEFSVSGSPVTSAGTLAVSKANQSANLVFAGPSSGGAAAPGFRSLVAGDLPTIAGRWIKRTIYTTGSGTHTPDAACVTMDVHALGAGGGGAGASSGAAASSSGGGGCSGGYSRKRITVSGTYSYAVGAAASAASAGSNGTAGGDTTFGSLTAKGGNGGTAMASGSTVLRQAGGAATSGTTGGDINIEGGPGEAGKRNSATVHDGGNGADAPMGLGLGGVGGFSANGGNATGYGAGGGGADIAGAAGSKTGGVATGGLIIVDEYT